MPPSSLIFVVIVGIWAAFFVQYWVRRREHIATARSVDAFTETMRVLEIRDPQPQAEVAARPRSYAVSPARPVRPSITVKRAEAQLTARDLDERIVGEPSGPSVPGKRPGGGRGPVRSASGGLAGLAGAVAHAPRSVRGLTVVVGFLGTLGYAVLSLLGVLVPWAATVPLGLTAVGVAWLRTDVRADARAHQVALRAGEREDRAAPRRGRGAVRVQGAPLAADPDVNVSSAPTAPVLPVDKRDLVFDVRLGDAVAASSRSAAGAGRLRHAPGPLLDEDDMPLTWDPAPVPMPTYTMKAPAHRVAVPAEPAPGAPAVGTRRVVLDAVDADWDDDVPEAFPARRATG